MTTVRSGHVYVALAWWIVFAIALPLCLLWAAILCAWMKKAQPDGGVIQLCVQSGALLFYSCTLTVDVVAAQLARIRVILAEGAFDSHEGTWFRRLSLTYRRLIIHTPAELFIAIVVALPIAIGCAAVYCAITTSGASAGA